MVRWLGHPLKAGHLGDSLFVILNFVTNLWPANIRFVTKFRMTNKNQSRLKWVAVGWLVGWLTE